MRKSLSLILALALAFAFAAPALAANETTGSTTVTYDVTSNYTITIPGDVTIAGGTGTQNVSVNAGSVIDPTKSLQFKITNAAHYDATDGFRLKNNVGTDVYLSYTITYPTSQTISDLTTVFLSADAAEAYAGKSVTLTYTPVAAQSAGVYTDTLTFTIGLV